MSPNAALRLGAARRQGVVTSISEHDAVVQARLVAAIADAVVAMDEAECVRLCEEYLARGLEPRVAIMDGLAAGMRRAGQLYEEQRYFIIQLLLCSDAMYAGLEVLRQAAADASIATLPCVVIGVVAGDTHDVGKNLVKILLEAAGFEVVDLGRDVPHAAFVEAAREHGAQLVCLSTLMSPTMAGMGTVVRLLEEAGMREQVKVMIGGGSTSPKFATQIGADAHASSATDAVRLAKELLGV